MGATSPEPRPLEQEGWVPVGGKPASCKVTFGGILTSEGLIFIFGISHTLKERRAYLSKGIRKEYNSFWSFFIHTPLFLMSTI